MVRSALFALALLVPAGCAVNPLPGSEATRLGAGDGGTTAGLVDLGPGGHGDGGGCSGGGNVDLGGGWYDGGDVDLGGGRYDGGNVDLAGGGYDGGGGYDAGWGPADAGADAFVHDGGPAVESGALTAERRPEARARARNGRRRARRWNA